MKSFEKDINEFVRLSRYAGGRYDLVQAGGGNTSVKLKDKTFLVKASGMPLSEVNGERGYVQLDQTAVLDILKNTSITKLKDKSQRESQARELLDRAVLKSHQGRASIEGYMHALFDKFTLHTHPLTLNLVLAQKSWRSDLKKLFPGAAFVPYATPGIDLALAIVRALRRGENEAKIMFLQNHGLIVTGRNVDAVMRLNEKVLTAVEKDLTIEYNPYKFSTPVAHLVNSHSGREDVAWLTLDMEINQGFSDSRDVFFKAPFSPDGITFCGYEAVEIKSLKDAEPIKRYLNKFHVPPRVVIYEDQIFLIAPNVKKAKECEEVLRGQVFTYVHAQKAIVPLDKKEMDYLTFWEAEKYRQKI